MKRCRIVKMMLVVTVCLMAMTRCSDDRYGGQPPTTTHPDMESTGISLNERAFKEPPNILLVSVDTLRADFFVPQHMPRLAAFAKESSLVFTNAHSNSTWTKPSHVTMLTGMLSSEHGVEYDDSMIPENAVLVQQRLKQAGYATAAFVDGGWVDREWGFDRDFDVYYQQTDFAGFTKGDNNMDLDTRRERIRLPIQKAKEFLDGLDVRDRPHFLFVHTNEVHEFWRFHSWPETDRGVVNSRDKLRKRFLKETSYEQRWETYAKAAADLDAHLAELIESALASPLSENLCIIVTSDHGEGFGEKHGKWTYMGHGGIPFAERIRIPLFIYGMGTGRSSRLIGIDEITPLILWMAGVETASDFPEKRELLISEHMQKKGPSPSRSVAVVTPTEKYLLMMDETLCLYRDPTDSVDLLHSGIIGKKTGEASENLKKELTALGYLN